jgi:hypothetical protein
MTLKPQNTALRLRRHVGKPDHTASQNRPAADVKNL